MAVSSEVLRSNLKLLRNSRGFSQEQLSSYINLSRTTYSNYESGVKLPDLQTLYALAALYNISFSSLINYDLSTGIIHEVYFKDENKHTAEALNSYQNLSFFSQEFIMNLIDILVEI